MYTSCYIKLLNGGVAVSDWNWSGTTFTPTRTLYTYPNVPADIPSPLTCAVPLYSTMSRFMLTNSGITCNCTLYPVFQTLPAFDQMQILASDNATVIWDLDLSGTPCQDVNGPHTPSLTAAGNPWAPCGSVLYYVESTSPPPTCTPSGGYIETSGSQTMAQTFTRSWILAAPP